MNTPEPDHDPLTQTLQAWRVESRLPDRFESDVWNRIDRLRQAPLPTFWQRMNRWVAEMLPRPALAGAYITTLLVIGMSFGWGHARQNSARLKGELSHRYVQVLDPYLPTSPHSR